MPGHPHTRSHQAVALFCSAAILLYVALSARAITAAQPSAPPAHRGTLHVAFGSGMQTFDPSQAYNNGYYLVNGALYNGLYQFDRHGQPQLDLAAAPPTVSADRSTWTFRLRRGVRFSTGAEMTAEDVAFPIGRVLDPRLKPAVS